ncbi:hypothetical protein ACWFRM_23265 [Streptomyces sp. NPDC055144]
MDLLDWYRGRLSSRRLAVLVRHMPRDSALTRELQGEAAEWGVTDHLLAHAVDQLREGNWMFATVNRDEEAESLEFPEPLPRPGAQDTEPVAPADELDGRGSMGIPTSDQLAKFFGAG